MSSDIILHRVIVTLRLTDQPGDDAEQLHVTFEGDPPMVTALGMLEMAKDSMLHGPNEDE